MSTQAEPEQILVQRIAQEWVKPQTMGLPPYAKRYPGHVALLNENDYPLILVWTERICSGPHAGRLRQVLVKEEDL